MVIESSGIKPSTPERPHWFVIAGDFNICPWTQPDEHANLLSTMQSKLGFYDVFQHLSCDAEGQGKLATCEDNRRIDYFWTNIPKVYVRSLENGYLPTKDPLIPKISDHQALQVIFDLPYQTYEMISGPHIVSV